MKKNWKVVNEDLEYQNHDVGKIEDDLEAYISHGGKLEYFCSEADLEDIHLALGDEFFCRFIQIAKLGIDEEGKKYLLNFLKDADEQEFEKEIQKNEEKKRAEKEYEAIAQKIFDSIKHSGDIRHFLRKNYTPPTRPYINIKGVGATRRKTVEPTMLVFSVKVKNKLQDLFYIGQRNKFNQLSVSQGLRNLEELFTHHTVNGIPVAIDHGNTKPIRIIW